MSDITPAGALRHIFENANLPTALHSVPTNYLADYLTNQPVSNVEVRDIAIIAEYRKREIDSKIRHLQLEAVGVERRRVIALDELERRAAYGAST